MTPEINYEHLISNEREKIKIILDTKKCLRIIKNKIFVKYSAES